ncbi:hypothetical protein BCV69DRAFT_283166 [Microstroma glucosiphilum]|uniref:Meiotically up-regulated protein Msb1/Mug8 domain-containing protein n=1 Tax=Pseudomicrostroma glucosiphilum TaxID=1684307 RepID=A0A316U512_9BASI|nr:hypothetical protein BCV69DRAFT_283166 [Pseudomicrostroma glucosiphilum]PWN20290.1 hypothetical protein BCV69DRAFT_283166 [Pseudomicrostroma glucosiphilum]
MTTLFSRRPGKSGRFAALRSVSTSAKKDTSPSLKAEPFGAAVSNTDLPQSRDDEFLNVQSRASTDARTLEEAQIVEQTAIPPVPSKGNLRMMTDRQALQSKSLPTQPMASSRQDGLADDFGRMMPSASATGRNGVSTLPLRNERNGAWPAGESSGTGAVRRASHRRLAADLPLPPSSVTGAGGTSGAAHGKEAFPYGYTHEGWETEMTLQSAHKIVELCAKEIRERGLDCPLIFTSMALDLSTGGAGLLLKALASSDLSDIANSAISEEVRFANPHDLAALLKWTLARLGRFYAVPVPSTASAKKGETSEDVVVVQQRGWLDLDLYLHWREEEKLAEHPWTAFRYFVEQIDEESIHLLLSLFSLLSSTCSYSLKNGMTPSKLARHFGVVLFGLPEDETFARTYDAYNRASNATEHLLLAYIRNLATYEVLPVRLMSHVEGYPQILSSDFSTPPRHVRQVPYTHIERQVRLYSQDLIQSASEIDVAWLSPEWEACCSASDYHGKHPQFSDRYRKLINVKNGSQQPRDATPSALSPPSSQAMLHTKSQTDDPAFYGTIAQEEWGQFMNDGFTSTDRSKLSFDLHESERKARTEKRSTVLWSEFTDVGFGDADRSSLDAILSFDDGLKKDVTRWPSERAELLAKLRDTASNMPPFAYDTAPKVISRPSTTDEYHVGQRGERLAGQMDEVFAEVWADYLIGNGWSNRDELTHRSANFVVVQYKSRPNEFTVSAQGSGTSQVANALAPLQAGLDADIPADDRTEAAWFVVQEIVPSGYRAELEAVGKAKSRSRPSMRNLNVFRKMRKDRSASGSAPVHKAQNIDEDASNLFPPGTKKISLGMDPAMMSDPSTSVELKRTNTSAKRRSGQHSRDGSKVSLFSTPLVPERDNDLPRAEKEPSPQHSSASKFVSAVRKKTLRRSNQHEHMSSNEQEDPPAAPSPPSKVEGGLAVPAQTQSAQKSQNGGFPTSTSGASFCSADYEARSVIDSGDEREDAAKPMGRRRSLLRHLAKHGSRDEHWVDIVTKSPAVAAEEDAQLTPPATRESDRLSAREQLSREPSPRPSPRMSEAAAVPLTTTQEYPSTGGSHTADSSADTTNQDANVTSLPLRVDEPLDVLPAPPLKLTAAKSPAAIEKDTSPPVIVADRSILKPVATDAQIREQRISAAQARARELRAKLQPVDARKAQQQAASESATVADGSASTTSTRVVSKGKLDPFAKNPTSGKVASIAARFGAAPGTPPASATSPSTSATTTAKVGSLSPNSTPHTFGERSPSPLSLARFVDQQGGASPLVSGMVDPNVPPSPRRPESMIGSAMMGDTESIAPDDAASNYSRSTEEGAGLPYGSYDKSHTNLNGGGRPSIEEESQVFEQRLLGERERERELELELQESGDAFSPLTGRFREPYQPGQPLENLQEESESMLSGSH